MTVAIGGTGRFKLCPADGNGLPVTGSASSSWSLAWPAERCRLAVGGDTVRLPDPPDAHVGLLLLADGAAQAVSEVKVQYRPIDAFAGYRLGEVRPQPTLLRGGGSLGRATATVYDECAAGLAYRVAAGSEQSVCRSTVTGEINLRSAGVIVRATGAAAGPTPLIVVNWPGPTG